MSQTNAVPSEQGRPHGHPHGQLRRTVGFWGLMFVSLGSIIGSGWLLSALSASEVAGPAAILSWILAAIMLTVLALVCAALRKRDPDRPRTYVIPMANILTPAAFCSATLLLYWGGFQTMWKIDCALIVGLILFSIGVSVARTDALSMLRPAVWLGPWLLGMTIIDAFGRYTSKTNGVSSHTHLANCSLAPLCNE